MSNNDAAMSSFTRGSQLFMHTVRMIGQGTKISFLVSASFVLIYYAFRSFQFIYPRDLYYWLVKLYATLKIELASIFINVNDIGVTWYDFTLKAYRTMPVTEYQYRICHSPVGQRLEALWGWMSNNAITELSMLFAAGLALTYGFFVVKGREKMIAKKTRGNDLILPKELRKKLKKERAASNIELGGLPLVKGSERQHILITGTTGTGKTNFYHELIPQIKKRGEKAVVVDLTGAFIGTYFDPDKDKILNPFDERTENWLPWADCEEEYDYDALAKAIIGESSHKDFFWEESATKILVEALKYFKHDYSLHEMMYILTAAPLKEYSDFFAGTLVASLTSIDGDKTVTSIRATMNNKIKALGYLNQCPMPFSLRDLVLSDREDWLYITARPNQRATLSPLLASWIEVILNSLMLRSPNASNSNLWVLMDELPALGKVPSLKTALAESRKYGGCLVAGVQNIHQLINIYGRSEAMDLLDQFNTRYIFRVGEQETAKIASQILGEKESRETQESLSYGANTIRDGVNINTIERKQSLVLPTEIMTLQNLSCYAKLAGSWPVTKLVMKFHNTTEKQPYFIKKEKELMPNSE